MTTIPNYRLNPHFARWDDAAFEWLTEYELSLVDPTEGDADITTPMYVPDEEESTFSALFLEYDAEEESTTLKDDRNEEETGDETDLVPETTSASPEEDYNNEDFEEPITEESSSDSSTENTNREIIPSKDSKNEDQKQVPSLSGGMLLRGLSFVTFMVVPFVILL